MTNKTIETVRLVHTNGNTLIVNKGEEKSLLKAGWKIDTGEKKKDKAPDGDKAGSGSPEGDAAGGDPGSGDQDGDGSPEGDAAGGDPAGKGSKKKKGN